MGLPAYQALVEPSGGYVLPHTSLKSPQLKRNLNYVLQDSFMSRSLKSSIVDSGIDAMLDWQCLLDIRTDRYADLVNNFLIVDIMAIRQVGIWK